MSLLTTNNELLAVVMAVELFIYYLTRQHFTVVTDHASLTWLRNFKEPEGNQYHFDGIRVLDQPRAYVAEKYNAE